MELVDKRLCSLPYLFFASTLEILELFFGNRRRWFGKVKILVLKFTCTPLVHYTPSRDNVGSPGRVSLASAKVMST